MFEKNGSAIFALANRRKLELFADRHEILFLIIKILFLKTFLRNKIIVYNIVDPQVPDIGMLANNNNNGNKINIIIFSQ